ncbi:PTS glucose transporter subunit IIB [Metamycoplasma auris]|uniref:PTS system IIB component (Glc family) n=1 Tax=Metamycoplasma auris TaxID=51363 RepID=A0A2W7G553_9BACT|nr:PTS glucose transporter subunit IIB [Metamycoplasma auris]PZV98727.1 PTS system IIB component (Glc family) [Metamycoplasma auris]
MNNKNKFLYVFLIIITFGFILIYWKKKYRQSKTKNYLSKDTKINFDTNLLIEYLGGIENIQSISSTQKVIKINFYEKEKIKVQNLKQLDGVSGLAIQSKSVSLVVGNIAKYLEEKINGVK